MTRLELQGNCLTDLSPLLFNNLKQLRQLNLAHNGFVSLDESLFRNLKELKYLNLINVKLKNVDVNIFRGLNKIEHARLSATPSVHTNEMLKSLFADGVIEFEEEQDSSYY